MVGAHNHLGLGMNTNSMNAKLLANLEICLKHIFDLSTLQHSFLFCLLILQVNKHTFLPVRSARSTRSSSIVTAI